MRRRGDNKRGTRGAAAVEFALVAPILILLVFGIIDFGYLVNRVSVVNNAARDAAREGSLNGTHAQITSVANDRLSSVPGTSVAVTCLKPNGSGCSGSYDSAAESGGTSVVTITYVHDMITPISYVFGDTVGVSRSAKMRIE